MIPDEPKYTTSNEEFSNPEKKLKESIELMKSDDWQKNFDGLNNVKRIAKFHKKLLSIKNKST